MVYCWYMPGPICCVTTFCLQLHLRVPGAGFHTLLSRVTCRAGRVKQRAQEHMWGIGPACSGVAGSGAGFCLLFVAQPAQGSPTASITAVVQQLPHGHDTQQWKGTAYCSLPTLNWLPRYRSFSDTSRSHFPTRSEHSKFCPQTFNDTTHLELVAQVQVLSDTSGAAQCHTNNVRHITAFLP